MYHEMKRFSTNHMCRRNTETDHHYCNIVESGVKHHNTNTMLFCFRYWYIYGYYISSSSYLL